MSRLDKFKGNIRTFIQEDRVKGEKVSSERKKRANGIKNLLHGRNSDKLFFILSCIDCPAVGRCEKIHDGYCTYLLEEMKPNRDFSKQVARCLHILKEGLDSTAFLKKKWS